MYAKHGNLVDSDASGTKASTKHLASRLKVTQGHAFWDHWKADEGRRITSPFSRTPLSFDAPLYGTPADIRTKLIFENWMLWVKQLARRPSLTWNSRSFYVIQAGNGLLIAI